MSKCKILICKGKSCRKASQADRDLNRALEGRTNVVKVGCQGLCSGPVVGLETKSGWALFDKIRKPKHRDAVLASLSSGAVDERLGRRYRKTRPAKKI